MDDSNGRVSADRRIQRKRSRRRVDDGRDARHLQTGEPNADTRLIWTDETFLLDQGVAPWSELPLWIPAEYNGIFEARNDKAIAAGLTFRPLADTVSQTLRVGSDTPAG